MLLSLAAHKISMVDINLCSTHFTNSSVVSSFKNLTSVEYVWPQNTRKGEQNEINDSKATTNPKT